MNDKNNAAAPAAEPVRHDILLVRIRCARSVVEESSEGSIYPLDIFNRLVSDRTRPADILHVGTVVRPEARGPYVALLEHRLWTELEAANAILAGYTKLVRELQAAPDEVHAYLSENGKIRAMTARTGDTIDIVTIAPGELDPEDPAWPDDDEEGR